MVQSRNSARRRRLVVEPTNQNDDARVQVADSSSAPPSRKKKSKTDVRVYSYGADRRNQRKTTDLIPKRRVSVLFVVMLVLAGLWLINVAAANASDWATHVGDAGVKAFAIRGKGSLASWFSSFLLIMTGLASLQIYALRQHRRDDYRGTYRLWLWTALLLILASVHCVTDIGTVAANFFGALSGASFAKREWIPLAFKLTALSLLMGRGLFEVQESRGSFALVVFVWIAYSAAAVMQLPAVHQNMVVLGSDRMLGNFVLFGTAGLLLAHLTYARYVFMNAHGLIVQREKKKKTVKAKKKTKAKPKTKTKAKPTETTVVKATETAPTKKRKTIKRKTAAEKKTETAPAVAPDAAPVKAKSKRNLLAFKKPPAKESETSSAPEVKAAATSSTKNLNELKSLLLMF